MKFKLLLTILVTGFSIFLAEPVCPNIKTHHPKARDPASEQLTEFRNSKMKIQTLSTDFGVPIGDKLHTLTAGPRGPVLLQDTVLIEEIAHFDRERIPERVVHAKGAGAFGYFKVTNDITKYCKAKIFSNVGKITPVAVRFSLPLADHGSPDVGRQTRGFAIKFYTEEGNWDLVGLNIPIFYMRDPFQFPSLIHSQKRNPVTNLYNTNMYWDFLSLRPEATFAGMWPYTDYGTPYGFRYIDGHGLNTFKMVNENNEAVYCKLHYLSNQGNKTMTAEEAIKFTETQPDFSTRDLYNSIAKGDYPSWTLYIQVMTFDEARNFKFNPFDATKFWPKKEFPFIEVGTFTLNRNPTNYFADVEQLAFAPSSLVPGIEPSPDKVLQGRLFSYPDTQRYRLGANYLRIPVNRPKNSSVHNYQRDGFDVYGDNQDGAPNYYPNSFCGPTNNPAYKIPPYPVSGDVERYNSDDEDNFTQAGEYYREVLDENGKETVITNLANSLVMAYDFIQERAVNNFAKADRDFGKRLQEKLQSLKMKK